MSSPYGTTILSRRLPLLVVVVALAGAVSVGCAGNSKPNGGGPGNGGNADPPTTSGGDNMGGAGGTGTSGSSGAGGTGVVCTGVVTGSCSDRVCDVMPGCTASVPPACTGTAKACSAFDGAMSTCDAQWGCGPGTNGVCGDYVKDCSDIHNQQDCQKYAGCWWASLYCNGTMSKNCPAQSTRESCQSNAACSWTASKVLYCSGATISCGSMTSDTCEMQQGCVLTPAICTGAPAPCETLSQDQCLLQPGCHLRSGGTRTITPTGIQVKLPDLAISKFSLTRATNALSLEIVELNRGSVDAPAHTNVVVFSKNEIYGDGDDYTFSSPKVSFTLPAYGFDSASLKTAFAMPAASSLAPGYYYPMFVVDSEGTVKELEEANNLAVLAPLYIGPDVVDVTAVSLSHSVTAVLAPGNSFQLSLAVKNSGTVTLSTAAVAIYLSLDSAVSVDDIPVDCTASLSLGLVSGKDGVFPLTCTAPRARGPYTLIAEVDPKNALGDANRTDNTVATATPITVKAPSPDLQIAELSSSTYSPDWKGTVTLSAKVVNAGTDPAPASKVNFYLKGTKLLCTADVNGLEAGASVLVTRECTLDVASVGKLPLRAEVDPKDLIFEADETNNATTSATDLVVATPDVNLVAAGVGIVAGGTDRKVGQTLPVYFDIRNTGTKDAPPFRFIVYASDDTKITSDDLELCIRDATTGQAAGTTTGGTSTECTVPTLPTGVYYIGMIVDTGEAVPETVETDNITVDSANKLTIIK